jgi:hypothetical protein
MEQIIRHLNSSATVRRRPVQRSNDESISSNEEQINQLIGGIGTIEGRIWIVFSDNRMFSKAIIRRENDIRIMNGLTELTNLERGPTGHHDILIDINACVQLLYCHQIMDKITCCGNVTLCGRTFIIECNEECVEDYDDCDDCDCIELNSNQHLQLISGCVNVRVSAGGHKIYLDNCNNPNLKYRIITRISNYTLINNII